MKNKDDKSWDNATWEGSRKAQLRASLKLTPKQRFEALEELAETAYWFTNAAQAKYAEHVARDAAADYLLNQNKDK